MVAQYEAQIWRRADEKAREKTREVKCAVVGDGFLFGLLREIIKNTRRGRAKRSETQLGGEGMKEHKGENRSNSGRWKKEDRQGCRDPAAEHEGGVLFSRPHSTDPDGNERGDD